jgi:hypothetical protein
MLLGGVRADPKRPQSPFAHQIRWMLRSSPMSRSPDASVGRDLRQEMNGARGVAHSRGMNGAPTQLPSLVPPSIRPPC